MATITYLILLVYRLFPFADYRWLTKEMNTNLPLELDFKVEVLLTSHLTALVLPYLVEFHVRPYVPLILR